MENAIYASITRQSGLLAEMQSVANNVANAATTGYRAEGVMFTEWVEKLGSDHPSLSMAAARVRETNFAQGSLSQTGGPFDLAVEGEGFFLVETPAGIRLTRAGHFTPNAVGDLVTAEGYPVLDPGGAPVFVPPGASVGIGADGTISADGQPIGQVGLVRPLDPQGMSREDGVRFESAEGWEPVPEGRMLQGFLEESNIDPIREISRMIEISRAYELGQSLIDREDERIRSAIRDLSK